MIPSHVGGESERIPNGSADPRRRKTARHLPLERNRVPALGRRPTRRVRNGDEEGHGVQIDATGWSR